MRLGEQDSRQNNMRVEEIRYARMHRNLMAVAMFIYMFYPSGGRQLRHESMVAGLLADMRMVAPRVASLCLW